MGNGARGKTPQQAHGRYLLADTTDPGAAGNLSLSTVYRVCFGEGTDSPLFIGKGTIGVGSSPSQRFSIGGSPTAVRDVTLLDRDQTLAPMPYVRTLAQDWSNTTTSDNDVPFPALTGLPPGFYRLNAWLILVSVATTTGVRVGINVANALLANGPITAPTTGTLAAATAPVANQNFYEQISYGFYIPVGSTGTLGVTLRSEVSGSSVGIQTGSLISITPLS